MDSNFDFSTPVATRRRGAKTTPPATAATKPTPFPEIPVPESASEEEIDKAVEAEAEGKRKSKYDPEELASIFDEILFSGEYSEQVSIRGKLNVVFRTRTADEVREINRVVDGTTAVFANTLEGVRSLMHLQYALMMYQGKDLRGIKPEERAKFIGRIPGPVVGALLASMSKFDEKVFEACQEAEENF